MSANIIESYTFNKYFRLFNEVERPMSYKELRIRLGKEIEHLDEFLSYRQIIEVIATYSATDYGAQESFYFWREQIEKFWIQETEIIFEDLKSEITLPYLRDKLGESFIVFYELRSANSDYYKKTDAGIDEDCEILYQTLKKFNKKYYFKRKSAFESSKHTKIGLNVWLTNGISENPRDILKEQIINSVFKELKVDKLPLDKLTFRMNRLPNQVDIEKPFSQQLIKEIVLGDKLRFNYGDNIVELIDDIPYYTQIFENNQKTFDEFSYNTSESGFLAFRFVGVKFPLEEAEEYVSTRPIIYITKIVSPETEITQIINPEDETTSELHNILRSILPNDLTVSEWLKTNTTVSFAKSDSGSLASVFAQLISGLSPVFNLKNNPKNLFQYSLEKKLEEYNDLNKVAENDQSNL